MTDRRRRATLASFGAAALFLVACGGKPAMPSSTEVQAPAEVRTGEVTIRATTLPTLQLNDAMARQYGIERDADAVLLVVGLRRGPAAQEASVPGRIDARATDLLGNRKTIGLREIRSDGYIDYVGTVPVSMPDTLRFEIVAAPDGAPAATLRFHRDFFP